MIDKTPFFRAALGVVVLAAGTLRVFGFVVISSPTFFGGNRVSAVRLCDSWQYNRHATGMAKALC